MTHSDTNPEINGCRNHGKGIIKRNALIGILFMMKSGPQFWLWDKFPSVP